jgi:hypothetical protein
MKSLNRFVRSRFNSGAWALVVLMVIEILTNFVSKQLTVGQLTPEEPELVRPALYLIWVGIIIAALALATILWTLNDVRRLRIAIFAINAIFTLQLFLAAVLIVVRMIQNVPITVTTLIGDALVIFITNILIFALWYWFIDSSNARFFKPRSTEQWDFLFPQRQGKYPGYADWAPRFTDYVYVAYTMSVAFSPTDTPPLSRAAKLLTMTQSMIALIVVVVVAGTAINILASSA